MNIFTALRGALVLIVVGAGLGFAFNALRPDPLPWKATPKAALSLEELQSTAAVDPGQEKANTEAPVASPTTAAAETDTVPSVAVPSVSVSSVSETTPAVPDPYPDLPRSPSPVEVSLAKAKELYDRGGLLVLDARDREEYDAGHIRGAQAAPYDEMVGDSEWMEKTAKDPRPILAYCDGQGCDLSLDLALELAQYGHRRVLILEEGFPAWSDAGYPVSRGEAP